MLLPFIGYAQNDDFNRALIITADRQIANAALPRGHFVDQKFTLIGNVDLEIYGTNICCDSAIVDLKKLVLSVYGNVSVFHYGGLEFNAPYISLKLPRVFGIVYNNSPTTKFN